MNDSYNNLTHIRDKTERFLSSLNATIELGKELGIDFNKVDSDKGSSIVSAKSMSDNSNSNTAVVSSGYYKKGQSLKETVKLIVTNHISIFTQTKDIVRLVLPHFPKNEDQMKGFRSQVSGLLSVLKRDGFISQYFFGSSKKDSAWGKVEWLDKSGNPIEGKECIVD